MKRKETERTVKANGFC